MLEAIHRARQAGDTAALLTAGRDGVELLSLPDLLRVKRGLARELFPLSRHGVDAQTLGVMLAFCAVVFLEDGDRAGMEEAHRQLAAAAVAGGPVVTIYALHSRVIEDYLDGRFEQMAGALETFLVKGQELGSPALGMSFARRLPVQALLHLGRHDEAIALVQGESGNTVFRRMYVLARAGRHAEARRLLHAHFRDHRREVQDGDITAPVLVSLLETALLVRDEFAAAALSRLLEPAKDATLVGLLGFYPPSCPSRLLGDAAVFLGRPDEALVHYERALGLVQSIRCQPEEALARTRLSGLRGSPGGSGGKSQAKS